jgi:hypothetical protein
MMKILDGKQHLRTLVANGNQIRPSENGPENRYMSHAYYSVSSLGEVHDSSRHAFWHGFERYEHDYVFKTTTIATFQTP